MKPVVLVSRRAAGVWTHLPSLVAALLSRSKSPLTCVWIDLGARYEMLNHLAVDPATFLCNSTLEGLAAELDTGRSISVESLVRFADLAAGKSPVDCSLRGEGIPEYRLVIEELASQGKEILLIPLTAPTVNVRRRVDQHMIRNLMDLLHESFDNVITFITLEGQPEGPLFRQQLVSDRLLAWCLEECSLALSFVRFDSFERFRDSVAVPRILAEDEQMVRKLRLVLNRVKEPPDLSCAAAELVLGTLSFLPLVGTAVAHGRVPLIDILRKSSATVSDSERRYEAEILATVAKFQDFLSTERAANEQAHSN